MNGSISNNLKEEHITTGWQTKLTTSWSIYPSSTPKNILVIIIRTGAINATMLKIFLFLLPLVWDGFIIKFGNGAWNFIRAICRWRRRKGSFKVRGRWWGLRGLVIFSINFFLWRVFSFLNSFFFEVPVLRCWLPSSWFLRWSSPQPSAPSWTNPVGEGFFLLVRMNSINMVYGRRQPIQLMMII